MRSMFVLALAAILVVGSTTPAGGDRPAVGRQIQFNLRVFQGDPLGSREAGTLKLLAEPCLVTREGYTCTFATGGEIAVPTATGGVELVTIGLQVEGKPGAVKHGKVYLDLTLSETARAENAGERLRFDTHSTRTITTVKLGETFKLRWGQGTAERQQWVELVVTEVGP